MIGSATVRAREGRKRVLESSLLQLVALLVIETNQSEVLTMQSILGIPIAFLVLGLEITILLVLVIGWLYGARRKKFKFHHKAVWFVVFLHILTVGLWMIPIAFERLTLALSNPLLYWYQIVHDIVGLLAIGLGAILVAIFLVKGGMPWKLIKKTRPLMFLTIGTWIVAFLLGLYWFRLAWLP